MDVDIDEVVLTISTGVNDAEGSPSQIVLQDAAKGRRSHTDDVTRGTVGGNPVEQHNDKEIPSNFLERKDFLPNVPSLTTERQPEALDLQEHDQQEAVVDQPTEQPLAVASDRVRGDAPDPVQSDRSECEYQWPRNTLSDLSERVNHPQLRGDPRSPFQLI